MKCKVVTGYVPLDVKHLTEEQFRKYGDQLFISVLDPKHAAPDGTIDHHKLISMYDDFKLEDCWLHKWLRERNLLDTIQPATDAPTDRFATPHHMVLSNILMHQRTTWMVMAAQEDPSAEVLVWIDFGIFKQGDFTGKPVREEHIKELISRIERSTFDNIPFPGIWPDKAVPSDTGPNWRFAGSVHIIPRKHLFLVDEFYRYECRKFIERTGTVPLDLPIWALTEINTTLPFHWYQANHDATQFTNFPYPRCDTCFGPMPCAAHAGSSVSGAKHSAGVEVAHNEAAVPVKGGAVASDGAAT